MSDNVYVFVPNIIGYLRVITALISFYVMPTNPLFASVLYTLSAGLDAVDGKAARYFDQSTKFGAVLDMVTDRTSTAALMVMLAHQRPHFLFAFQMLIMLDIFSHWMQMYASMLSGSTSHKIVKNPILAFYYSKYVLFTLCTFNEMFFCSMYMGYMLPNWAPITFYGETLGFWILFMKFCFPFMFIKQFMNVVQLYDACQQVVAFDIKERQNRNIKNK